MKKNLTRSLCLALAMILVCFSLVSCKKKEVFEVDAVYAAGEPVTQSWTAALKELEKRSDGRIKVNHYYAGSLLTFPEIPMGMQNGTGQWAYLPTVNYVDIFPLSCRILQLPFMGFRDPLEASEIFMQLFDEFPEIAAEMEPFNMLPISVSPLWGYHLHLIDKDEVRVPADLAGRSIVPYKTELQPMLDKFNVASTFIPPGQMYESLERSVIAGYINCWAFANWFGLHPFLNQHVTAGDDGFFQEFFIYVVALDQYNSMPADLQKLWTDLWRYESVEAFGGKHGYEFMWDETKSFIDWQINYARENDHLFVELTPAEIQIWKDELAYTHKLALDEINAQRGDQVANAVYNRAIELIQQKYGA